MNTADTLDFKKILEASIMAATEPMSIDQLKKVLNPEYELSTEQVKTILEELKSDYQDRGIELKEVATGFRFQVIQALTPWVQKLWHEKPVKYSRAFLETLALIVYRQPITRAEIEDIRGVAVSTTIIKTLMEREWVKVIGHKEVPGRPALYATTKQFLNDFNLKSLSELPPLSELVDLEQLATSLEEVSGEPTMAESLPVNVAQEVEELT